MRYTHCILRRYFQKKKIKQIYLVVVYTSNVTKVLDISDEGSLRISSNAVLISEYKGNAIMEKIKVKTGNNVELSRESCLN